MAKKTPETLAQLLVRIRACEACAGLPLGPRPVIQADAKARVAVIGHAPGRLVHASGIPWDDYSGVRLREWLGLSKEDFYDPKKVALVGMGFCYPGTGKTGDLPPRPECAPLWHEEVFSRLRRGIPRVLIGSYALKYYLGKRAKKTLTETVKAWKEYAPDLLVLPHPSGRNNGWLAQNPWFEREALPGIRSVIRKTLVVAALFLAAGAGAAPRFEQEKDLRAAIWAGRWLEGIKRYEDLERSGVEPSPQASYLVGKAYWDLRQPEKAQPYLQKALDAGFQAGKGRPQPGELLDLYGRFVEAMPPAVDVPGLDAGIIELHAEARTAQTAPVIDALPRFVAIGRKIFGGPPPSVRFFLFDTTEACDRFAASLGMKETHSTGIANIVLVNEEKARRPTEAESVATALHESGHAWVGGYLRYRHDRRPKMPIYVAEGLAIYIASLWDEKLRALARERLRRRAAAGARPPDFDDLVAYDYARFRAPGDGNVDYLLSGLLMERLLGAPETGAPRIPAFLDALATENDDAAAWRAATGKDVRAEYAALTAEYWPAAR